MGMPYGLPNFQFAASHRYRIPNSHARVATSRTTATCQVAVVTGYDFCLFLLRKAHAQWPSSTRSLSHRAIHYRVFPFLVVTISNTGTRHVLNCYCGPLSPTRMTRISSAGSAHILCTNVVPVRDKVHLSVFSDIQSAT
jgi:hypothetical protein